MLLQARGWRLPTYRVNSGSIAQSDVLLGLSLSSSSAPYGDRRHLRAKLVSDRWKRKLIRLHLAKPPATSPRWLDDQDLVKRVSRSSLVCQGSLAVRPGGETGLSCSIHRSFGDTCS